MIVGSIFENQTVEKRVAITPEIVKKYISLGIELLLVKDYGKHLGISDEDYTNLGVKFFISSNLISVVFFMNSKSVKLSKKFNQ